MIIQRATILERPQIQAMVTAYKLSLGREDDIDIDLFQWWIVRGGETVLACFSYTDYPDDSQRWVSNFFRVAGRSGSRAWGAMWHYIYDTAEKAGLDVTFMIDPRNVAWRMVVEERQQGELVGLFYRHRVKRT